MKALIRTACIIAFAVGLGGPPALADDAGNEALARRFYTEFNNRNLDAFGEFIAADFVDHNPVPGQAAGLDGLKKAMQGFAAGSSDIKVDNEFVIAKGDLVTVYSICKGTHTGEFLGVPATKKPIEFHAIDIWRVKDGKLAEGWHVEELLTVLAEIGALGQK
jgi:steroid delta-isomerase-like uncharacterized protein